MPPGFWRFARDLWWCLAGRSVTAVSAFIFAPSSRSTCVFHHFPFLLRLCTLPSVTSLEVHLQPLSFQTGSQAMVLGVGTSDLQKHSFERGTQFTPRQALEEGATVEVGPPAFLQPQLLASTPTPCAEACTSSPGLLLEG